MSNPLIDPISVFGDNTTIVINSLDNWNPSVARIVTASTIVGISFLLFFFWLPVLSVYGRAKGLDETFWFPEFRRNLHLPVCFFLFVAALYAAAIILDFPNEPVDLPSLIEKFVFYVLLLVTMWVIANLLNLLRDSLQQKGGEGRANGVIISQRKMMTKLKRSGDFQKDVAWGVAESVSDNLFSAIHSGFVAPLVTITKVTILTCVLLVIFGFNLTAFVVVMLLAFGTFGFSLAAGSHMFGNLSGALVLLFEHPFDIGDVIEVGSETGYVEKIGLRSTVLRRFDMKPVFMPNHAFVNQSIINWTRRPRKLIELALTCSHQTPTAIVSKFENAVDALVKTHPNVDGRQYSRVCIESMANGFNLSVKCYTAPSASKTKTRDDLVYRIYQLAQAFTISLHFGATTVINTQLEAHVPKDTNPDLTAYLPPSSNNSDMGVHRYTLNVELRQLRAKVALSMKFSEIYVVLLAGKQQWSSSPFKPYGSLRQMHFNFDVTNVMVQSSNLTFEVYSKRGGNKRDVLVGWVSQTLSHLQLGSPPTTHNLTLESAANEEDYDDDDGGAVTLVMWLEPHINKGDEFHEIQVEVRDAQSGSGARTPGTPGGTRSPKPKSRKTQEKEPILD